MKRIYLMLIALVCALNSTNAQSCFTGTPPAGLTCYNINYGGNPSSEVKIEIRIVRYLNPQTTTRNIILKASSDIYSATGISRAIVNNTFGSADQVNPCTFATLPPNWSDASNITAYTVPGSTPVNLAAHSTFAPRYVNYLPQGITVNLDAFNHHSDPHCDHNSGAEQAERNVTSKTVEFKNFPAGVWYRATAANAPSAFYSQTLDGQAGVLRNGPLFDFEYEIRYTLPTNLFTLNVRQDSPLNVGTGACEGVGNNTGYSFYANPLPKLQYASAPNPVPTQAASPAPTHAPNFSNMTYYWSYIVSGSYAGSQQTTCYIPPCPTVSVDDYDCFPGYWSDTDGDGFDDTYVDPYCVPSGTTHLEEDCSMSTLSPCATQVSYSSPARIEIGTTSSPTYPIANIFDLPGLRTYLDAIYQQSGNQLLNPRIEIFVAGVIPGTGSQVGYTSALSTPRSSPVAPMGSIDIPILWPSAPSVNTPNAPTGFSTPAEATYGNAQVSVENAKCKGGAGKITINAVTGRANLYYFSLRQTLDASGTPISGQTMNVNQGATPQRPTTIGFPVIFPDTAGNSFPLLAGTYTLKIENYYSAGNGGPSTTGCISQEIVIKILEPAELLLPLGNIVKSNYNGVNISCKSGNDGIITVQATGGIPPYSYILTSSNGMPATTSTTGIFTGLSVGDYTVVVRDALFSTTNNCVKQVSGIIITEPTVLLGAAASVTPNHPNYDITCFGGTTTVNVAPNGGTNNYTVSLGGITLTATNTQTASFANLAVGTHTFIIKDANLCETTITKTLIQAPEITFLLPEVTNTTCFEGSDGRIRLSGVSGGIPNGAGDYTYNLVRAGSPLVGYTNPTDQVSADADFTVLPEGTYTLKITDSKGCIKTINNIIIAQPAPLSSATILATVRNVSCLGGADGEYGIRFIGGNSIYNVEWRKQTSPASPWLNVNATSTPWGGLVTPIAGGAGMAFLFKDMQVGTYEIRYKDTNNCNNNDPSGWVMLNFPISEPATSLTATATVAQTVTCFGGSNGSIDITASGGSPHIITGYQYSIDGGAFVPFTAIATITGQLAGSHSIVFKDANNCTTMRTVTISQPLALSMTQGTTNNPRCFGATDGSIVVNNITGGTAPYQISIDNGANWTITNITTPTTTISNLGIGAYQIRLKDANLCVMTSTITVTLIQPTPISLSADPLVTNTDCGQDNGEITVNMTGGTPGGTLGYTYIWQKYVSGIYTAIAGTTNQLSGIYSGTYRVIVTDSQSCVFTSNPIAVIDIGSPNIINQLLTSTSCFGTTDGGISFEITSGLPPYQWRIAGGAWQNANANTTINIPNLRGGTSNLHTVEVRGSNNCTRPFIITVPEPAILAINFTLTNPICINEGNGTAVAQITGGNGGYTYLWKNATGASIGTGTSVADLYADDYELVVTDNRGCTLTKPFILTNPPATSVSFPSVVNICQGNTANLDAGNPGAIYEWKNSQNVNIGTGRTISIPQAGNYELKIITPQSCVSTHPFSVEVRSDLVKANMLVASEVIAQDTIVLIDVSRTLVADPNNLRNIPDRIEWSYSSPDIIRIGGITGYTEELKFMKEGIYTVRLKAYWTTCSDEITRSIVVLPRIAKNDNNGLGYQGADITKFIVAPNPSNGVFAATVELNKESTATATLYSLQSNRSMATQTHNASANKHTFDFNEPNLPSGFYALVITTPNETKFLRIIIER